MPVNLFSNVLLYLKAEVDSLLASKASTTHGHAHAALTGIGADDHHPQVHNHDSAYSATTHNHNAAYATVGHTHTDPYTKDCLVSGNGWGTVCTITYNSANWCGFVAFIVAGQNDAGGGMITWAFRGTNQGGYPGVTLSETWAGADMRTYIRLRHVTGPNKTYLEFNPAYAASQVRARVTLIPVTRTDEGNPPTVVWA